MAVAAALRIYGLWFGLPHTQARPDETHIIEAARRILSGAWPNFYDYPWLYIFLLALSYFGYFGWGVVAGRFERVADMVASWPQFWPPFFLISRALSAMFGILTVWVVFRIGRRLWGDTVGLIAALFMSVAFIHARDSHFGTTDTALTFFIFISVGLLVVAHETGRRMTFALAGLAGGLGAATKYNAVLLAAPLLVSYLLHVCHAEAKLAALKDLRLLDYGLPFLAGFAVGVPFVMFDFESFQRAMGDLRSSMAQGDPRLGQANGFVHHLTLSLRFGLGLPLLTGGVTGALLLCRRMPRRSLLLAAFPVTYYVVAGSIRNLFFRYMLPLVPFFCLLFAYLVWEVAGLIAARWDTSTRPVSRVVVAAALAVAAALPSAVDAMRFALILSRTDSRVLVADWFARHVPAGSSVVQSGSRYGLAQFPRELAYREWRWDGASRRFRHEQRADAETPEWIVVQDSPLPSATQDEVRTWLANGYVLVTSVKAFTHSPELVYDRQDMFYVPFAGLQYVTRPGPNFDVYARRDALSHARATSGEQ